MTGNRSVAALIALLLLTVACGDDSVLVEITSGSISTAVGSAETTTSTTEPASTTTTQPPVSTTVPETSTSTTESLPADPFAVDHLLSIEAAAPPELTGADALIGGTPERGLAAALTAELEQTGVDLTGTRLDVRPVTGTTETLLVLWIDDTATALAADDTAADTLFEVLLGSPIVSGASITRLVINYQSEDVEGPFVLTATADIDTMRTAWDSGEDLPEDAMLMQVVRVGAP